MALNMGVYTGRSSPQPVGAIDRPDDPL